MRIRDVVVRGGTSAIRSGALRFLEDGALVECPLYIGAFNWQGQDWQSQMSGTLRITAGQRLDGTAEAFTLYAHGLGVGDVVRVAGCTGVGAFNGLQTVTAVNDPHSFSFALAGTTALTYETTGYVIRQDFASVSRARASNVSTLVTSTAHSLKVGQRVVIQGVAGSGYNDTETVVLSAPTTTSFTYANAGSDEGETSDTNGTIMVIDVGITQGTIANPSTSNRKVAPANFDLLRNQSRSGLSKVRSEKVTLTAGEFLMLDANASTNEVATLTAQVIGGTPGFLYVSAITNGSARVITSSSATDTSTVGVIIRNP